MQCFLPCLSRFEGNGLADRTKKSNPQDAPVLAQTPDMQAGEAAAIDMYNAALAARLEQFKAAHPEVEAVLVDTAPAFNEALGNPAK